MSRHGFAPGLAPARQRITGKQPPRAERPERKNGIDIRPQDLVQFTLTKAKAGVTGMRRKSFAYGREQSLPLVFSKGVAMSKRRVREISIFVDESGSFESDEASSRFYLICFVMHDQGDAIGTLIDNLELSLAGLPQDAVRCVHMGPLIRREPPYSDMSRELRQSIFRKMMAFVRKANISYRCFAIDKHYDSSDTAVHDRLLQDITRFLIENAGAFNEFDALKVYYDNGQAQVKSLLREAFAMFSSTVEFVPDVVPAKYRLFQAADLICTIELIAAKTAGMMTESEKRFFGSHRVFVRDILRQIRRKLV
jgi:hypothetical protein